jgi:hypothetical protein
VAARRGSRGCCESPPAFQHERAVFARLAEQSLFDIARCGPLVSVRARESGQLCGSDFGGVIFYILNVHIRRDYILAEKWLTPGANSSGGKVWSPPGYLSRFRSRREVILCLSLWFLVWLFY